MDLPQAVRDAADTSAITQLILKERESRDLGRSRGERAGATMSAVIEIPVELKGAAMNLLSYARFVYRAERREGTWRIFSFDAIYLRDELTPFDRHRSG